MNEELNTEYEDTRRKTDVRTNQFVNEANDAVSVTQGNTRGLANEQYEKDKEELNKNQNANYAKDGGQYGRVNNKDYSRTLRLARMADEYNSRHGPLIMQHDIDTGNSSVQEGPKRNVNTVEQRTVEQSFNLDTNQKQLAQALQDSVNRKDLEAFKMLYQQLYGVELDRMHAEIEMRKFTRQQQIQQIMLKDRNYFERMFGMQTATILYNMVKESPVLANYMSQIIVGFASPNEAQVAQSELYGPFIEKCLEQGMSQYDANELFQRTIAMKGNKQAGYMEGLTVQAGKRWYKRAQKKQAKADLKEDLKGGW